MTTEDVRKLSNVQYNELINLIAKKLNWDIQTNLVSVTGKLETEESPLYPEEDKSEEKVFRLADALALQEKNK